MLNNILFHKVALMFIFTKPNYFVLHQQKSGYVKVCIILHLLPVSILVTFPVTGHLQRERNKTIVI